MEIINNKKKERTGKKETSGDGKLIIFLLDLMRNSFKLFSVTMETGCYSNHILES